MKRLFLILVVLVAGVSFSFSKERGPREAEHKAEAPERERQESSAPNGDIAPFPFFAFPEPIQPIVKVYTKKATDEESQCSAPKDWKEWGSFVWCRSLEWIDAERVIAVFTIILGIATWLLWCATRNLVKGAEKTAEQQLRAYVYARDVRQTWLELAGAAKNDQWKQIGRDFYIEVTIENAGQTPTKYAVTNINHRSFNEDVHDEFDFPDSEEIGFVAFGPATVITTDKVFFNIDSIKSSRHTLVWGWVEYNDVFKGTPRRRTEFCFEVRIGPVLWNGQYPIDFPHFKRFNGADTDCVHNTKEYRERLK